LHHFNVLSFDLVIRGFKAGLHKSVFIRITLVIQLTQIDSQQPGAAIKFTHWRSQMSCFYPWMGSSFASIVFTSGGTTSIYHYSPIPLFTLEALTPVNFKDSVSAFDFKWVFASFTDTLQAK
jgi:hypothetical protein